MFQILWIWRTLHGPLLNGVFSSRLVHGIRLRFSGFHTIPPLALSSCFRNATLFFEFARVWIVAVFESISSCCCFTLEISYCYDLKINNFSSKSNDGLEFRSLMAFECLFNLTITIGAIFDHFWNWKIGFHRAEFHVMQAFTLKSDFQRGRPFFPLSLDWFLR